MKWTFNVFGWIEYLIWVRTWVLAVFCWKPNFSLADQLVQPITGLVSWPLDWLGSQKKLTLDSTCFLHIIFFHLNCRTNQLNWILDYTNVHSVRNWWKRNIIWKIIFELIQAKNHSNVPTAVILANKSNIFNTNIFQNIIKM